MIEKNLFLIYLTGDDQIVSQSISALKEFFNLVKDLRNAHWRLDQSKKISL